LEGLWKTLAVEDPQPAYQAVWRLAAVPAQVVPFLQGRLRPSPGEDVGRIPQLIVDLDSDRYALRSKATEELAHLGLAAEPALRQVLACKPSLEVRRRVEGLLERLENRVPGPEQLRHLRAVAVLEQIGTSQAQRVLERLTKGKVDDLVTESARLALARLTRRPCRQQLLP
jgi:hypothetical protein